MKCWYSNNKPSPIHHHFYGWDFNHQKWVVCGIAIPSVPFYHHPILSCFISCVCYTGEGSLQPRPFHTPYDIATSTLPHMSICGKDLYVSCHACQSTWSSYIKRHEIPIKPHQIPLKSDQIPLKSP